MSTAVLERVAELERRAIEIAAKAPSAFFTPNPAQWRYLKMIESVYADPSARERVNVMVWMGANDTGKTRMLSETATNLLIGPQSPYFDTPLFTKWPRPTRGRMISTQKALEEGLIRELRAMLGPHMAPGYPKNAGHPYPSEWVMNDGSRFDLFTWDQPVTQHAGAFVDWLIMDEPGKRQVFNESAARLRRGGPVFWAMTPVDDTGMSTDLAWVFEEISRADEGSRNGWSVCYADAEDNCAEHGVETVEVNGVARQLRGRVPHAVIEDRKRRWEGDPATLQARFFGRMVKELGRVLKEWDPARHIYQKTTIHPGWPVYAAIDTHPSKPQVFVCGALDMFGRFWVTDEVVSTGLIPEFAEQVKQVFLRRGFPRITLVDPLAATPNPLTGVSIMNIYREHLRNANIVSAGKEKVEKNVGIALMRERLAGVDGRPLLMVHESCKLTISQAGRWMIDQRTMAPAKEHDDTWECLYRIILNLPRFQTQQQADIEERMEQMSSQSSLVI